MGVQISPSEGAILWKEEPTVSIGTFCRELCKNGQTDRFAVWIVDSRLAPPGEYDLTVHLWRRCGLMSNYFDQLLVFCYTRHDLCTQLIVAEG